MRVSRERLGGEYALHQYTCTQETVPIKTRYLDETDFDWELYDTDGRALIPEDKKPSSFFFPACFKETKETVRDTID